VGLDSQDVPEGPLVKGSGIHDPFLARRSRFLAEEFLMKPSSAGDTIPLSSNEPSPETVLCKV